MKIAYIYYNFYPITGGASVHGYYLAKELSKLGYELFKLNGDADPYTKKLPGKISGLLWMLRHCDLFYIRMDYFRNFRNLITWIAFLFNKKIVVELNSPSDELHLFGKSKSHIIKTDKRVAAILKRADAVVVVSDAVKKYCNEALGLHNVFKIENGGEVFAVTEDQVSGSTKRLLGEIRENSEVIVMWSGSLNLMQHMKMLQEISEKVSDRIAIVMITKGTIEETVNFSGKNVYLLQDLGRQDVEYAISNSDVGLALYGDYSWSRWGFYNSSLKVFEYLNNGLETISNKEGTAVQKAYPNFHYIRNTEEIVTFLDDFKPNHKKPSVAKRTWKDAAAETSHIFKGVTR